jgi:hypothetical protein
MSFPRGDRLTNISAIVVIVAAVLLALPAFLIPLGLPIEGDAVDYRIPIVRWILRHQTFPNWSWTMVDDYPALGELAMVPLYAIHPSLARLVPLCGYLLLGCAGGAIAVSLDRGRNSALMIFSAGMAWTLALRPIALQSNALMNDNLAAGFLLASLALALRARPALAGVLAACALATRYSVWGTMAFLPVVIWSSAAPGKRVRSVLFFAFLSAFGALPFMIRNFLVNHGRPFFPVDAPEVMRNWGVDQYGRGSDIQSFLLLPFDLLYTNTFVKGFFDYTLGKLIYVQLLAFLAAGGWYLVRKRAQGKTAPGRNFGWLLAGFVLVHTVVWFTSSQQLRFLVPALVVANMAMLVRVAVWGGPKALALPTLLGVLSITSVHGDSIRIITGKMESTFVVNAREATECFSRAGVGNDPVGYLNRDGMLGFFDKDFVYLPTHSYGLPGDQEKGIRWIYESAEPRMDFEPWPPESPCIMRRLGS